MESSIHPMEYKESLQSYFLAFVVPLYWVCNIWDILRCKYNLKILSVLFRYSIIVLYKGSNIGVVSVHHWIFKYPQSKDWGYFIIQIWIGFKTAVTPTMNESGKKPIALGFSSQRVFRSETEKKESYITHHEDFKISLRKGWDF